MTEHSTNSLLSAKWLSVGLTVLLGTAVISVALLVPEKTQISQADLHSANLYETDQRPVVLAEETQQNIWDLEHFTFELERRLFPRIIQAISERSANDLEQFFKSDFLATIPAEENSQTVRVGAVRKQRRSSGSEIIERTSDEFAEYLVNRTAGFQAVKSLRLRVLGISPEGNDGETTNWKLTLLLQISGESTDGRIQSVEDNSYAICSFETDDEIRDGRIFSRWDVANDTTTTSQSLFEESTVAARLDTLPLHDNWDLGAAGNQQYSAQFACADWTLDGRPDLAIATIDGRAFVLSQNESGEFQDVTLAVGLSSRLRNKLRQSLVTFFDVDNDGDPDLLLGARLYENRDGREFKEFRRTGLQFEFDPMGCAVADYDCDGRLDLYVLYQHGMQPSHMGTVGWVGDDLTGAPNALWRNLGDGKFENTTATAGVAAGTRHSFAAAWLHADDDHWPDLYVANDFAQNSLFLNRGDGTFRDASESSGTADFATSMGVAAADIDGDSRTEIYVANMYSKMGRRIIAQVDDEDYPQGVYSQLKGSCAGNRLYRQVPDADTFTETSDDSGINAVGWAYAPAFADFDFNGFPDIYATAGFLSFDRSKPDG